MDYNMIFRKIASENGISVTEVKNEIQTAIDMGMNNPDPKIQEYWQTIPRNGEKPTPEEVIAFVSKNIK